MNYIFTDNDRRNYKRKTTGPLTIKSEQNDNGMVEIFVLESGNRVFSLTLDRKETAGIISALSAATAMCKIEISI